MTYNEVLLEQYKIAVEMADRVSSRREEANKIFLSVNSVVFAFLATQSEFSFLHILIAIFGGLLCTVWASIIKNYRNLNSAKYKVIHKMEEELAWKVYTDEWDLLKKGTDKKTYGKLTVVEKKLPMLFFWFYMLLLVYVVISIL